MQKLRHREVNNLLEATQLIKWQSPDLIPVENPDSYH